MPSLIKTAADLARAYQRLTSAAKLADYTAVSDTTSPAEWAQYRRDVLNSKAYADGGSVPTRRNAPMPSPQPRNALLTSLGRNGGYNAQNPMDHGQRRAPTQERINQAMSDWDAMKKGARNWAPDVAGFFLGDIPDALTYVARRAANVQGEQSIPSLGAGNAVRRAVHDLQAQFGLEDKFVPPSGQVVGPVYEPSTLEQVTQFLNPLALVNPTSATKTAGRGAAEIIARAAQSEGPLARMATAGFRPMNVVKQKGGNFLSGSVEDALSNVKREAHFGPGPAEILPGSPTEAINSWIDKALTKYVKNQMATPEDPIRALAEQGVLHYEPGDVSQKVSTAISHRASAGMPVEPTGQSELARTWDTIADYNTIPVKVGDLPIKSYPKDLPWLQKASPETMTYQPMDSTLANSTGFDHLIDELGNAINPESGLPRHLLFPVDRLDKVSVPQAVQRVSDINKWRAAQKAEADAIRANNAATVLHKEYPEKGMKWVQLKQSELPEGWSTYETKGRVPGYMSPEGLPTARHPGAAQLQDALKYEGDIMGHCVGGYCDDVVSGKSKIYSLRDSKGQPHVTIEVGRKGALDDLWDDPYELQMAVERELGIPITQVEVDNPNIDWEDAGSRIISQLKEAYPGKFLPKPTDAIIQIKGKGNAKPHDDYLPYVQDFVKSGQWSDVGDLQNTGLVKGNIGGYMTPEEALAVARYKLDPEDPRSLGLSHEVSLNDAANLYYPDDADRQNFIRGALTNPQNFAQGGSVAPNKIETLGQLRAIMATLNKVSAHA